MSHGPQRVNSTYRTSKTFNDDICLFNAFSKYNLYLDQASFAIGNVISPAILTLSNSESILRSSKSIDLVTAFSMLTLNEIGLTVDAGTITLNSAINLVRENKPVTLSMMSRIGNRVAGKYSLEISRDLQNTLKMIDTRGTEIFSASDDGIRIATQKQIELVSGKGKSTNNIVIGRNSVTLGGTIHAPLGQLILGKAQIISPIVPGQNSDLYVDIPGINKDTRLPEMKRIMKISEAESFMATEHFSLHTAAQLNSKNNRPALEIGEKIILFRPISIPNSSEIRRIPIQNGQKVDLLAISATGDLYIAEMTI